MGSRREADSQAGRLAKCMDKRTVDALGGRQANRAGTAQGSTEQVGEGARKLRRVPARCQHAASLTSTSNHWAQPSPGSCPLPACPSPAITGPSPSKSKPLPCRGPLRRPVFPEATMGCLQGKPGQARAGRRAGWASARGRGVAAAGADTQCSAVQSRMQWGGVGQMQVSTRTAWTC